MICQNCGKLLDEDAKFCAFCGASQGEQKARQAEVNEPSEKGDMGTRARGLFRNGLRKGTTQTKIIVVGVLFCLILFVAATFLTTCFGACKYYQLDTFVSQTGSKIVKELEFGQGLEYTDDAGKYIDFAWTGVPKDTVEPCDGVLVHFEDENQEKELSRDDLNAGVAVGAAYLYWTGDELEHWSDAPFRIDSIMKKCGFGSVIHEGQTTFGGDGWEKIGKCKLNGKDAYWGIGIDKKGKVSVAVKQLQGNATYDELSEGVSIVALMA